jgi:oligopeptide/dipeptide ABC transporter ATP-binding protein
MNLNRYVVIVAAAVVLVGGAAAGYVAWKQYEASALPAGIVSINGRVEATQVDISTKIPGRVIEIIPHEGDIVPIGSVVASIDTSQTMAQLHQAQASAELARQTLITRQTSVASEDAQLDFANEELRRTSTLIAKGWSTHETLDKRQQELKSAMILVTHDLGVVAETCESIAVMYAGRIVEKASVAQLFAQPEHPYTIGLLGSIPKLHLQQQRLPAIEGQVPSPAETPPGCRFAPRCPFVATRCREEDPALRDINAGQEAACLYAPLAA